MSVSAGRKRLFGVIIGNPPYQDERVGNGTSMPPIYHKFMDAVYDVSDKTILITPARFLFDAGATPKAWNRKMLADKHLKVVKYAQFSGDVFPGTSIRGGVAITYRDADRKLGPIGTFIPDYIAPMRSIVGKTANVVEQATKSFASIISARGMYHYSSMAMNDYPVIAATQEAVFNTPIATSGFDKFTDVVFFIDKPKDDYDYISLMGLSRGRRDQRWIRRDYVNSPMSLNQWKVLIPAAAANGEFGKALSTLLIGQPLIGHTDTFLTIGGFSIQAEAEACMKYVKTKFARALLGVRKITQHNSAAKWAKVPLQDFTDKSDIDWTQSVADIDQQLYAKYGLDQHEIDFIETHVKEMP